MIRFGHFLSDPLLFLLPEHFGSGKIIPVGHLFVVGVVWLLGEDLEVGGNCLSVLAEHTAALFVMLDEVSF